MVKVIQAIFDKKSNLV